MTILAHPDDESFGAAGVMARAVEEGRNVTVVCATSGEVGEIADQSLATPETLGAVRRDELRAACGELGVKDVRFLGYRDSGMAGTPDNDDPRAFSRVDAAEVVTAIVDLLAELKPSVVVTFDSTGGYGHPDHMAICRHTTTAIEQAAGRDSGDPRLFYTVISRRAVEVMMEQARSLRLDLGDMSDIDIDRLGVSDEEIDAVIDVRPWIDQKQRALAAHATQAGSMGPINILPDDMRTEVLGWEYFSQAGGGKPEAKLADLFTDTVS